MNKVNDDALPLDILDHCDLSQAVRGKFNAYIGKSYNTIIHHADGSQTLNHVVPPIELDDDVRAYFPDAKAVNDALRGLIALLPQPLNEKPLQPAKYG